MRTINRCDNMLPECGFKNELDNNFKKYIGKFYSRDLEIRRACHYCRGIEDNCILYQICKQKSYIIELNKLRDEINNRNRRIFRLQQDINELNSQKENLDREIAILNNNVVKIRSNDFLRSTIGDINYIFFKDSGYLDVKGTNNSIYRISDDGRIAKIKKLKKSFISRIKDSIFSNEKKNIGPWNGKIHVGNYSLEDAIAIVYMNIIKDSYRFDEDKGCGRIFCKDV